MIESTSLDGRSCKIQYLDIDMLPTRKEGHAIAFVRFEDGSYTYLNNNPNSEIASHLMKNLQKRA